MKSGGFAPSAQDRPSSSASLLVSMLVRYPELASVKVDPASQALNFVFLVRDEMPRARLQAYREKLKASLSTLWTLEGKGAGYFRLKAAGVGQLTTLEVVRDLHSLSLEEISLIIELTREDFGEALAREDLAELSPEEELMAQEEAIGRLLEDTKGARGDLKVTAVREDGRVLVFNQ